MPSCIDQLDRIITLLKPPQRIISLVPSQSELLADLDLVDQVVGITKFCVHPPEWFRTKTIVGGTKSVHLNIIHSLEPDLIIANKEENAKAQVEELEKRYPVYISNPNNLEGALNMIKAIGAITDRSTRANKICEEIQLSFGQLSPITARLKTAYLIWRNPYMTVGGDTFINDMLNHCGLQNMFESSERYPEITIEQLRAGGCQLLLLSSEPFPFGKEHLVELQALLPTTKTLLADGEMFSWYGSRLLRAPGYFAQLLRPLQAPA